MGVNAKTVEGWSTGGTTGSVKTQLNVTVHNSILKKDFDSVTATAKIISPSTFKATSFLISANITFSNGIDVEPEGGVSPISPLILIEHTKTDSCTVKNVNSASLTVQAGTCYATKASATARMELDGYGSWVGGTSVNF